jgi:hypothetical protein
MRERLDASGPQIGQLLPTRGEYVERLVVCSTHPILI